MDQHVETQLRHRKLRDRSLVLLVIGVLMLMPPIASIFHLDQKIDGLPITLVYLFVVWALLILGARLLAPHLPTGEADAAPVAGADAPD